MRTPFQFFILLFFCCSCQKASPSESNISNKDSFIKLEPEYIKFFTEHPQYLSNTFDYPVGKPDAKGYYNAQGFQKNNHLGDDWNAVTGGNTDLGDPIYAISNGYVVFAKDIGGGWGKVIRVIHKLEGFDSTYVESVYAHCDTILVQENQAVKRGEKIATIGTADGAYLAHLHLEIRDSLNMPIGGGYSTQTQGYLDPTKFIEQHRIIPQ